MSWKRGSSVEMSEEDENCDVLLVDESEFLDEEALLQPDADEEDQDASTNDDLLEGDGSEQTHSNSHQDALTDQEGDQHSDSAVKCPAQEQPVSQEQNESEKAEKSNSNAAKEDISESQPSTAEGAQEPLRSNSSDARDDSTGKNKGSSKKKAAASEDRPSSDIGQQRGESYRDWRAGSARSHAACADGAKPLKAAGKHTGRSSNARSLHGSGSVPATRNGVARSQEAISYSSRQQYLRGRGNGTALRLPMGLTGARAAALPLRALTRPAPSNQNTDLQHLLLNALTAVAASAPVRGMTVSQLVSGPARTPFASYPLASALMSNVHRELQEPEQRFPAPQRVQQEQPQRGSARPYDNEGRMMHRAYSAGSDGPTNVYEYQGHPTQQNSREASPAVAGRRGDAGSGHQPVARDNGEEKVQIDYNHGTGDCDYRIPHLQQRKTRGTADGTVSQSRNPNLHVQEALPGAKIQPRDFPNATTGEQPLGTRASTGASRSEISRQAASDGYTAAATEPFSHQADYGSRGMAGDFVSMEAQPRSGPKHDAHIAGVDDAYLKGLRQQELRREEIMRRKEAQRQLEAERKRLELERSKVAGTHQIPAGTSSEKKSSLDGSVDRQLDPNRNSVRLRLQPQATPADLATREVPAAVTADEKDMAIDRAAHGVVPQQLGQPVPKRRQLDASSGGAVQAGTTWLASDNTGKSPAEKQRLLRQRLLQLQQQSGMKRKLSSISDGSRLHQDGQSLSTAVGTSIKRDIGERSSMHTIQHKSLPVQQQPTSTCTTASRAMGQSSQRSAWHTQQWQPQDSQEHRPPERDTNPTASWPVQSAFSGMEPTTMNSDGRYQNRQASAGVPRKHYEPAVQPSADVYNRLGPVSPGITSVRVWNMSASTTLVTLCMLAAECGRVNNAFFTNDPGQALIEFATDAAAEMFCRKYNNCTVDRAIISAALDRR